MDGMEKSDKGGGVRIVFPEESVASDPQSQPVLIVGQLANLHRITFDQVKHKLLPRVTQEVWTKGLVSLSPTTSDSVGLYLGLATLACLPAKCSRHAAPARPHALASIVKAASSGVDETIVVVCEWQDALASAGAIARSYPIYSRKSSPKADPITVSVEFLLVGDTPKDAISHSALAALADSVRHTARIVDTPCNEMNVQHFLDEIEEVGRRFGLELQVIRGEELRARGMNGIHSVGQAALVPPALAVLSYKGGKGGQGEETIAWVGKGIVYDTGGLSIKGKAHMPGMKRDCGGAAGVLGAMAVAAQLGFRGNLHAVFCLAENAVGPAATRPDDVVTLYSGRSVEINNTDAEGRLVLADGVAFAARDLGADVILDMATLTGAQGVATGKFHAALLTNTPAWEAVAPAIARHAGDLAFPIVFAPELHFPEFNSSVADMKNSVADRTNAQPSCAGLFILAHLGFDFPGAWIHVDMASPVHSGERATGYGVALLTLLFGHLSEDPMIRQLHALALNSEANGSNNKKFKFT